jgi:hypothetical protein
MLLAAAEDDAGDDRHFIPRTLTNNQNDSSVMTDQDMRD